MKKSLKIFFGSVLLVGPFFFILAEPPVHAEWEMVFQDEFNGTEMNWDLWHSDNGPRGRFAIEGRYPDNNVLKGGCLHQVVKNLDTPIDNCSWTTAHIWSKEQFKYGYFEARIKMGDYINNAFWLFRDKAFGYTPPFFEIDIVEGHTPLTTTQNYHFFSQNEGDKELLHYVSPFAMKVPSSISTTSLANEFHTYAVEWNKDRLVWYIDGVPVRVHNNVNSHVAADIRLSTIILQNYVERDQLSLDDVQGNAMVVDWVRGYKKVAQKSTPDYGMETEVYAFPSIQHLPRRVFPDGEKESVYVERFDQVSDGALPGKWIVGNGAPSVKIKDVPAGGTGRALKLNAQEFAYFRLDEPMSGFVELDFDVFIPESCTEQSLHVISIGDFVDPTDPVQMAKVYYTGDVGVYVSWKRNFISYYPQNPDNWLDWRHFAESQKGSWAGARFTFDIDKNIFDYLSGTGKQEFRGSGGFRRPQRKIHGFAFRHGGSQAPVYVDNIVVKKIGQ